MIKKTEYKPVSSKKLHAKVWSLVVCVIMLAIAGYFLWQIVGQAKTTFTLVSDISNARKELAELNAENTQLTEQIEKLQNTDYVQSYARSKYLITKQGEQVYQLPAQDDNKTSENEAN